MMKKYFVVGMVICLLLIVGCTGDKTDDTSPGKSPFVGGSKGLVATFEPLGSDDNGVYAVFDDDTFPLEILLQNKGEADIAAEDVNVEIYGIRVEDFANIEGKGTKSSTKEIEGISRSDKVGGEEIIDFTSGSEDAKYLPKVVGIFEPEIFAAYDYIYRTEVIVPKVCFKESSNDEGCDLEEEKDVFVSSAPVQVTKVEEFPAGKGKVRLEFTVENEGTGKIATTSSKDFPNYDKLGFTIETDADEWDCRGSGGGDEIRMSAGVGTITCTLLEAVESDKWFIRQFRLNLDYKYRDVVSETLRIKESE